MQAAQERQESMNAIDQDLRAFDQEPLFDDINDAQSGDDNLSEEERKSDVDEDEAEAEGNQMEEEYQWEEKTAFFYGLWTPTWLIQFNEQSGPRNLPREGDLTPFGALSLLLSEDLIDLIVQSTNKYARVVIGSFEESERLPNYLKDWKEVTHSEIIGTLGIFIYIGIVSLPRLEDYWKEDTLFPSHIISKLLSFRRFYLITKFLHVSDVRFEDAHDKLAKIRPLLTPLIANWRKYFYPQRELTIDERMIKFTGRLGFKGKKTHMVLKPSF